MQFPIECIPCMLSRTMGIARQYGGDEKTDLQFLREILQSIADSPADVSSAYLNTDFERIARKYYPIGPDRYAGEKRQSNAFMLQREQKLRELIWADPDPLQRAICFSRTGNYIDFSALKGEVDFHRLDQLLMSARDERLDATEYAHFTADLKTARALLYLCDNAGEIVADKLVVEVLGKLYPDLSVTVCVRGGPAANDALREDAEQVGLSAMVPVIDNGAAISGTELAYIGEELKAAIGRADVILAKGMANFEAMRHCGLNVYYLFLCKCPMFCNLFQVEQFTGMFINDRRIPG